MSIVTTRSNLLFVLSAPSGCGKTTVCRAMLESDPMLAYSLSTTTRPQRPGETDGVAYDFVDGEGFEKLRDDGVFLEWAEVHGNFYGTRRDLVAKQMDSGHDVVLDIDVQGAMSVRRNSKLAVLAFILPPSLEALEQRLRSRETDDEAVIQRRLANARKEIEAARDFDYVVVNDDLEQTIRQLWSILSAERLRAERQRIVCRGEGGLDSVYPASGASAKG